MIPNKNISFSKKMNWVVLDFHPSCGSGDTPYWFPIARFFYKKHADKFVEVLKGFANDSYFYQYIKVERSK